MSLFSGIGSVISGAANAVGSLFNTGYGVYQDQRNYGFSQEQFDYQKALNQQVMDREDTAVQRRMADLQAAGLNPNLAAGSAASASALSTFGGSAGSKNLPGHDLDFMSHIYDLQQKKVQTSFLKKKSELEIDRLEAEIENIQSSTDRNKSETSGIDLSNVFKANENVMQEFEKNWRMGENGANFLRLLNAAMLGAEYDNEGKSLSNQNRRYQNQADQYKGGKAARDNMLDQLRYDFFMASTDGYNNLWRMLEGDRLIKEADAVERELDVDSYGLRKGSEIFRNFLAPLFMLVKPL